MTKEERNEFINEMLRVWEYGESIISRTPKFTDFAVACVDHFGTDCTPYIHAAYAQIFIAAPDYISDKMDSGISCNQISVDQILELYARFREEQNRRQHELEFKENIDELQFLVEEYRNSEDFKRMLEFVGSFKWLAPYNAMLVQMQLPGAQLVLSGKDWAKLNRKPKRNARRLITLKTFGPVQCMFEYGDPEPIDPSQDSNADKLLTQWDQMLNKVSGDIDKERLKILKWNLGQLGIMIDCDFNAVNTFGGYLAHYTEGSVAFHLSNNTTASAQSAFIISVNWKSNPASQFRTICHELGHLFCRHLWYDRHKERNLTVQQMEFEAETVAWLVCKRAGITGFSEEYLALYAPDGKIPICSTEMIMKAVTKIETLMDVEMSIKNSPWYESNKKLKSIVESHERMNRKPRNLFNYNR